MSYALAYLLYAFGQAAVALWGLSLWRRERSWATLALLLPPAAVVYDNVIIAIGASIGAGPLLEALTVPRFAGHALLTPIWIVGAAGLALRSGAFARWKRTVSLGSWVLYGAMVVIGLINEVIVFRGELVSDGDVLYYTNVGRIFTPPPPSLTMLTVALIAGAVVLWRTRGRWPWMALGAIAVGAAQAGRTSAISFVLVNSGEVLMALSLVATLWYLQRRQAIIATAP